MYPPTYTSALADNFYLLYRWHMLSVKVKGALDKGLRVILKKSATSGNPTSYSLVKRYEGSKVWRTPFEAESVDEVYDFDTGKFTLEHLDENRRITFLKTVTPQVEDEDDDEDYDDDFDEDEDCYDDDEEECNGDCSNTELIQTLNRTIKDQSEMIKSLSAMLMANRNQEQAKASAPKRPAKARRQNVSV